MSFYKILVQPAKSSKGVCKICGIQIQKDSLRVQVRDDRKLNEYIMSHGGYRNFLGSQGMYRGGYIQTAEGCISAEKYFVHLKCYVPIKPHPFTQDHFKKQKFTRKHHEEFQAWLAKKADSAQPEKQRGGNKRKIIKKESKIKK